MKRDIGLIHKILRHVEEHGTGEGPLERIDIDGHSQIQVDYHVRLCVEAGFVRENKSESRITRLTWDGHNALDKLNAGCGMESIADCTP